jgi:hypothetical protein
LLRVNPVIFRARIRHDLIHDTCSDISGHINDWTIKRSAELPLLVGIDLRVGESDQELLDLLGKLERINSAGFENCVVAKPPLGQTT